VKVLFPLLIATIFWNCACIATASVANESAPSRRLKVYLAGPCVFKPDALERGRLKKELAAKYGFDALFPLDKKVHGSTPLETAYLIFQKDKGMMLEADFVIANMTPFRGPGMDAGTAFEMGFMAGKGKPVFAYTDDPRPYLKRVEEFYKNHGKELVPDEKGTLRDPNGDFVENWGLFDNLMMSGAVRFSGSEVKSSYEEALRAACVRYSP